MDVTLPFRLQLGFKIWGTKHILGGKDFLFYMFKKNFLGTTKFGGMKKIGGTATKCPRGYKPACRLNPQIDSNVRGM